MKESQSKILVVDDSSTLRKIIRSELEKGGYKVIEASNGIEALSMAASSPQPDLLTLDIEMPKLDGFKTCEKLYGPNFARFFEKFKDNKIPVIFVTAKDSIEDRGKGFKLGAVNFITKPFPKGEILSAVDKILKPGKELEGLTALVVDDSRTARNIVSRALITEGMTVIEAKNGLEGLSIMCNRMDEIDIVITDLEMPEMDGGKMCLKIRQELGLTDLPIIFFTGIADQSQLLKLFKAGGTDYVIKPFIKEEMLARIIVQLEKTRLNKRLRQNVQELRQSNKVKDEMVAVCSHDLRSPLNSILVLSGLLMDQDNIKGEEHEMLSQIKGSGELLLDLINDILDLAKMESDEAVLEMEAIPVSEIVRSSHIALKHMSEKKNQQIETIDDCPNAAILGHRSSLVRVINNLLSNAIKFTPEYGTVRISVSRKGSDEIVISVTDSGIGIKEKNIPKLFQKFALPSRPGTAGEQGTGLGLPIVKEIVEMHNGTIDVFSTEGEGSTFQIILPLYSEEGKADPTPEPAGSAPEKTAEDSDPAKTMKGKRVLVVDDNAINRKILVVALERVELITEVAESGQQAVDAVSESRFDAVLMDLNMPDMDGYEATRQIRNIPQCEELPVIAVTAQTVEEVLGKCRESGMQDCVTKPINIKKLIRVMAKYVL